MQSISLAHFVIYTCGALYRILILQLIKHNKINFARPKPNVRNSTN
jgi:hypothetical protein